MHILSKIAFISISICLCWAGAVQNTHAQSAGQPVELSAIYACKALADSNARLACYDNAVGRFETAQKSGEIVTISKTQVEKVERDAFGFNIPSLPSLGKLFGGGEKTAKTPKGNPLTAPVKSAEATKPDAKIKRPAIPKASDIKEVSLTLRKTTEFGYKKTRFFFTNGQVWEQADTTKVRVPKVRGGKTNTAEISKAALGSFLLRINGSGSAIRVRRVR